MKRQHLGLAIFALLVIVLSACGGGGGGGGKGGGGSTTSSASISGLVGSGSSGGGAGASLRADVSGSGVTNSPVLDAIVEILVYDKAGSLIDNATASTGSTGTFTSEVQLANAGGYVVVNVTKPGYTSYSKRIDYDSPADINLAAVLQDVTTTIVPLQSGIVNVSSASGETRRAVKIALFKDPRTGRQSIVSGASVGLRKQQGSEPVLEIEIPADPLLDAGVKSLKADLKSFVGNASDATSFPGEFIDSSGNRLITSGFDYINITTDTGESLGSAVSSALKAGRITKAQASEPTYLTRFIYKEMCPNLLRDVYCTTQNCSGGVIANTTVGDDGYQVPVYSYNSYQGSWVLLGLGTLDLSGDGIINSPEDTTPIADQDGNGVIDHKDYQKYCDTKGGLYMRIAVTNEDFLTRWWNLDYPLIFEQPKEICTTVTMTDQNGNPLTGIYLSLWDDVGIANDTTQSFNYGWGSTDSTGKKTLKAALTSNTDTDRTGILGYWDPINYIYNSLSVTLGDSPNCTQTNIQITKPVKCSVTGTIKDDTGAPVVGQYVYVLSMDPTNYFYNWAQTNSSGVFDMDARCNTDQQVYISYDSLPKARFNPNFIINSTAGYNESKDIDPPDDGITGNYRVTLNDIVLANRAPYVYGWLSTTSVLEGSTVTAYLYGWDNECDKPLNWVLKDGTTSIESGTWNDCWGYSEKAISLAIGSHPISLEVTDSKGKKGTAGLGTVEVVSANRPPVIEYAYGSASAVAQGGTITLYGKAYDLDGNSLSAEFQATSGTVSSCTGTSGTGVVTTTCTYTAPTTDGVVTITYRVSDDGGSTWVTKSFNLQVGELPSDVEIIIQ